MNSVYYLIYFAIGCIFGVWGMVCLPDYVGGRCELRGRHFVGTFLLNLILWPYVIARAAYYKLIQPWW